MLPLKVINTQTKSMNLISYVYGTQGNAKAKRSRHGMEKDWNRYDEPARKLMQHGDSMKKSKRWIKHKQQRFEDLEIDN
jgi:hypothetical protein